MNSLLPTKPLIDTLSWCISLATSPAVRHISQWVEDEIVLPNGPFSQEGYRHHRHPVSKLWFDAIGSGQWSRFAAAGPTQNGKTLMCYVAPVLYHLFEIKETVIVGLPSMDMANDKWSEDFLPVIEASQYRDLLPEKGEGSRGGQVKRSIKFRNGATLRFMTAGGNDKKRAGYTSRVLAVTETDGMDEAGEASREADKIEQLEGRTRAFGRSGKRIYLECTVSIERGRIWQEIKNGTDSRIVRPCPHCHKFVAPEREHLVGWQAAESETEAAELAHFACPECGEFWSELDRQMAARQAKLVHRGQEISPDGAVTGQLPRTQTLGFRWSAIDNPFVTAGDLGAEEWLARKSVDRENSEKKMRQFVWTLPYEPTEIELTPLDADEVRQRTRVLRRGDVPNDSIGIVLGVDTGKRMLHWTAIAVRENGRGPVIDYGRQTVESDKMGVHRGLLDALSRLRTFCDSGWHDSTGKRWLPDQVWIDSGWHEHTDAIYEFCRTTNGDCKVGAERYRPSKGFGEGQRDVGRYLSPTKRSDDIAYIGKEVHISRVRRKGKAITGILLVHLNADHWKSELHQCLALPADSPEAVTLFMSPDNHEHSEWAAHVCAEKQIEKFLPGRGTVITWERISRQNHWFDASYSALAAASVVAELRRKPVKVRLSLAEMAKLAKGGNR